MNSVDQANQTQLENIQIKTGKTLEQLFDVIRQSDLEKHGEIRDMLKLVLNLGYGDANALGLAYKKQLDSSDKGIPDPLAEIYSGTNADLRPIHEKLIEEIIKFGEFEIAPKKGYVSLRRKKQFAMIGLGTKHRIEAGIFIRDLSPNERLQEMPPGSMCQYKVFLKSYAEIDSELLGWLHQAYDKAA